MDILSPLDSLDLLSYGDRNEREMWPLLSSRFPSYESLWQRLIVPLKAKTRLETSCAY
jgi:hypothetical protein